MIFTPDERRALFALGALLFAGQILASVQRSRDARPDRELAAWLDSLTAAGLPHADSMAGESTFEPEGATDAGRPSGELSGLSAGHVRPRVPVRSREAIPPGILETGRLRINEATATELEALPGVGPSLAARIVEERAKAPFRRAEDLRRVKGIGPAKLALIAPAVDFGSSVADTASSP